MTVLGIRESKGLEFKRACVYGFFGSYIARSSDTHKKPKNGWKTVLLDSANPSLREQALQQQLPWQMVNFPFLCVRDGSLTLP